MSKKILVADDDPAILDAIKQMLEDEGYEVKTTADSETVRKIHKELPDLLLLDIMMSGIDGRSICKQLKHETTTRHLPIIMVSANKDTEGIAKEAGADDFLAKPFEINDLLKMVKKYT